MHPTLALLPWLAIATTARAAPSYCNGAAMDSYGTRLYPNGAATERYGSPHYPDGQPTQIYGAVKYPNGNPTASHGVAKYPNGAAVTQSGVLQYPNGAPVFLYGACRWPNGNAMEPCRDRVRLRSQVGLFETTLWLDLKEQRLETEAEISFVERGTEIHFSVSLKTGAVSGIEAFCN